jgi:hypothetical protein
MTTPYPFPTPADEFADKRALATGGTLGIGAAVSSDIQRPKTFRAAATQVTAAATLD